MFDASVKVPVGIEHGALYQFGNFDQCMMAVQTMDQSRTSARSPVRPKYCLADVTMSAYTVRTGATRNFEVRFVYVFSKLMQENNTHFRMLAPKQHRHLLGHLCARPMQALGCG